MIVPASRAEKVMAMTHYDVVVYRATWAGINTAFAAAAMGKRVAIIEPTAYIGGHSTQGGINLIDVIATNQLGGLAWQQIQQIAYVEGVSQTGSPTLLKRSSGSPANANYFKAEYAKPAARNIEGVLQKWMERSGADVFLSASLATTGGSLVGSLTMDGTKITSLITSSGAVHGRQFVDCSYEGDLMALAGCSYTVGRESSSTLTPTIVAGYNAASGIGYGETLAGVQASPPTSVYTGADLTDGGQPLWPLVANPGLAAGSGDHRIQSYSYRAKLALISGGYGAAFTQPAGYSATDYTAVGRIATAMGYTLLTQVVTLTSLLNGQIDLNANGPVSNDLPNGSFSYPEATPSARATIAATHKKWTQGLLYYLCNDAGVPAALRTNASLYGYDNREWTNNGYFPREMYVREARRLLSNTVVKQQDMQTGGLTKSDSIAMVSYDMDCHGPNVYLSGVDTVVRDGDLFTAVDATPQFPMSALLPKAEQVTNLIVVGTPSISHVAWCACRMESQMAQWGEAAGIIAALAINNGTSVQSVPYASVAIRIGDLGALTS